MPRFLRVLPILFVLLLKSAVSAVAALQWESLVVEKTAVIGQETIEVTFSVSNPDSRPITLLDVKPDCGCTTASLNKHTLASGEKGTVTAYLDARGLIGPIEKRVLVFSSDTPQPTTLTLRVTLPTWIEASPPFLWWSLREDGTPKETILTPNRAAGVRIVGATTDNPSFKVELAPHADGRHTRLTVTPLAPLTQLEAKINLALECPGAPPRNHILMAIVH